ncbi:MAG: FG-GAP-like repeat-containing protein [Candidatus Latescibacterota bacterium]
MKRDLLLLSVLLLAAPGWPITWDFDRPGDAQGWVAWEDVGTGARFRSFLSAEVADGVWRVPFPSAGQGEPAIELISPRLGYDSALFDQLRLRVRLVHTRPTEGWFTLLWTNATNKDYTEALTYHNPDSAATSIEILGFARGQALTYTTDWQEVVVTELKSEVTTWGVTQTKWVWEGELLDVRLKLSPFSATYDPVLGIRPEAIEVDWVRLTGVEEQLQGELPPPAVAAVGPGQLLSPPSFYPMTSGVNSTAFVPMASLGDLDADGDLDLVALWDDFRSSTSTSGYGWLLSLNNGHGSFERTQIQGPFPEFVFLGEGDLDQDGRMDLMQMTERYHIRLLRNDPKEGFVLAQEFWDLWPLGLADADGDGAVDLWTVENYGQEGKAFTRLWLNDGAGHFPQGMPLSLDTGHQGFDPFVLAQHLRQGKVNGLLWAPPWDDANQGYEVTYLDAEGKVVQEHLATKVERRLIRYAGDFDQDGDVDLVVNEQTGWNGEKGLDQLVNQGDGTFAVLAWQQEAMVANDAALFDLDGDGRLDPVFVDSDLRQPAVVVSIGQERGLPVQEGRYPLAGAGGAVLGGDVDGDGDVDLVVLERASNGTGGAYVLLNRSMERKSTAVTAAPGSIPYGFRLGANYPNPFNPQTWIPVEIPASGEAVQLRVYNLLGQPIRALVSGSLTPGYHAVTWDGRDERGTPASSGVYLYRLEAGAWRATGKMVKRE